LCEHIPKQAIYSTVLILKEKTVAATVLKNTSPVSYNSVAAVVHCYSLQADNILQK
jgi:hypothetical protein